MFCWAWKKANLNTFEKESQWTTKGFHWFIWIYIFPATLPGLCETSNNTQLLMVTELSRGALKNTLAHTHRSWPCQSLLWLPHQTIQASLVLSASPHLPAGLCRVISEPLLVKQMLVLTLIRIKQSSKSWFDQLASESILYLGLIWNGIYIYSISSEETVCVSEL